jgi:methylated-DNA-[protein]-cysteine S-methyltransferase
MQITTIDAKLEMSKPQPFVGYYESPIGLIEIGGTPEGIASLYFVEQRRHEVALNTVVEAGIEQVGEYFHGTRRAFDLPIVLQGTEFQRLVWQQLLTIPFGSTASYQEIADGIARPQAVRAVGAANGQNPISIIVPCHRVIGSDKSLTGYGGGLWRKEWLLKYEGGLLL